MTETAGLSALSDCGRFDACAAACAAVFSAWLPAFLALLAFDSVSCNFFSSDCMRCWSCLSSSRIFEVSDSCACAGAIAIASAMAQHVLLYMKSPSEKIARRAMEPARTIYATSENGGRASGSRRKAGGDGRRHMRGGEMKRRRLGEHASRGAGIERAEN